MPDLVLGPMLRFADDRCATVWVETSGPATVEVLGHSVPTFHVSGHHYALVQVSGLQPGSVTPYQVSLDGRLVWPPAGSPYPESVIRTTSPDRPFRLAFGSCRVSAPHRAPYTLDRTQDKRGVGVDALQALATRMRRTHPQTWPEAMLFVGDQVYADEVSPQTAEFIRNRRDTTRPPGEEVADFEEYTRLYREAWSEPTVRWLLSTMPTAMIFDDHDVHDDWNTSAIWRRRMAATSWWRDRIAGGLMSYWLYQHLGNLAPDALASDDLFARLQEVEDGGPLLREFALMADAEADGYKGARWSYRRDHGRTRLLVIDSRCGRMLEDDDRRMVDAREWDWIVESTQGDLDHLLIASSLPLLLPPAVHDLEGWNEAVCAGAWGPRLVGFGEKVREAVDLEHWGSFRRSFEALTRLIADIGSRRDGAAPALIAVLSGDVHYSYLAEASFPEEAGVRSAVYQAVCSPTRNPTQRSVQVADRFSRTRAGRAVGRLLARSAGVPETWLRWELVRGPWFHNGLTTLTVFGRDAALAVEQAPPGSGEDPELITVYAGDLVREPLPDS
ncbi:MAG: alkaline phosphatase D family protein [Mycobacteriales bacterium]